MKAINLFFTLSLIFLTSCTQEEEMEVVPVDTAVKVENLLINFHSVNEDDEEIHFADRDETLQINFDLRDDSQVTQAEFYFLINDNPELKSSLFNPVQVTVMDASFGYIIGDLHNIEIVDKDDYQTEVGDRFHFYIIAEDDTIHKTEYTFVVELK